MSLRDKNIHPSARSAEKAYDAALVTAVSMTQEPYKVVKPGHAFRVTGVDQWANTLAGAVSGRVIIATNDQVLGDVGAAIDAVPEKFQVGQFYHYIGGVIRKKAAATAIAFSAAYTVNNAAAGTKWGAFLIQIATDGTVSTKAVANDQVYADEATAIANLPAADAGKLAIGYITVESKANTKWTAQTDDLTPGSDNTDANFYDAAIPGDVLDGSFDFASLTEVKETLTATLANLKGTAASIIVFTYTSDGTGVLTNGSITVTVRPTPMGGETS